MGVSGYNLVFSIELLALFESLGAFQVDLSDLISGMCIQLLPMSRPPKIDKILYL